MDQKLKNFSHFNLNLLFNLTFKLFKLIYLPLCGSVILILHTFSFSMFLSILLWITKVTGNGTNGAVAEYMEYRNSSQNAQRLQK